MIGISVTYFDPDGDMIFYSADESSLFPQSDRRASWAPELGGGIAVDDSGYFDSGQELLLIVNNITQDQHTFLSRINREESSINISTFFGFFKAQVLGYRLSAGAGTMRLVTLRKLS